MPFSKYVKLPGSEREPMPGATKTGSVDPNEPMQVTLILRPRPTGPKQPSLDKLVATGKRITREQLAASYGADPSDLEKVSQFAAANGLEAVVERLGVPHWSPLQLRHTAATAIRAKYGVEAAKVILGHTKVETTQIYAERDLGKAREIMAEIG